MHSLSILTIVSCLSKYICYTLEAVKRDNVTLAAPIVAVPSLHWEGVDGKWSTFEIRVGTPATTYRILPVTSWQETWIVYGTAFSVCNTSAGVASHCQNDRGGVFDDTESSTWVRNSQFQLELNSGLGFGGVGQYGFDTVGLGYTNTTGPTLQHQIVSEIVSDSWWFGILGLGFQPTNFTDYANPQPSFADSLYANGLMSSMSWSYTAGAYYRLKGVFGSLIFGGYDESRFTPNNVIFTMAPDNLRDLVVAIRSITSNSSSGVLEFMSTPQFAFIDSSVPELWLPKEVCDAFAQAFNLTFDSPTGLYLVGPSAHSSLLILNPTIKITLANQKSGGSTASIELPYAAFDLRIAPPILANRTSYYFPIRQGKDETQYTLGRTFLQEAYVTAHYESRTFNVSQCVFTDPLQAKIIALPLVLYTTPAPNPSANTTPPTNSSSSQMSLSKGAIAGISTGVLALLVVILYGIIMIHRRRIHAAAARREFSDMETHGQNPSQIYVDEMATTGQAEMDGHDAKFEKFGNPIMIPQELEGVPVSSRAPVVEVGEREGGLSAVSEDTDDDMEIQRQGKDYVVSPKSAGTGSMSSKFESANGRRTTDIPMRPNIVVSSPGTSLGGNPASPGRESKFEEHL